MRDDIIVIYHGRCADGFTAAWLVNMYHSIRGIPSDWVIRNHAGVYGESPPDVLGCKVYVVDFSYSPEQMLEICNAAEQVIWIDHHESAIKAMGDVTHPKLRKHVSTERSGAYLTAQYLWPGCEPLEFVRLVDDRDRWQFHYPKTKPFHAGLFSRPYKIGEWNRIAQDLDKVVDEGEVILQKHWKDIREALDVQMQIRKIAGYAVPTANLNYMSASDACHEMLERKPDAPFAACWFLREDGKMVFSLRSRPGGTNVANIAKRFDGGGHPNSAGFAVTEWPGKE